MTGSPSRTYGARPSRPADARAVLADRHGLAVAGVVVVELAFAVLGAALDVLASGSLGFGFALGFSIGTLLATLAAQRAHLLSAVIAGPLVFVAVTVAANLVAGDSASSSFITSQLLDLAVALVTRAPTLFAGFGISVLVAVLRALGQGQTARSRPAPAYRPPDHRQPTRRPPRSVGPRDGGVRRR